MLEATNKNEAITSILDAVKNNAVWLNECDSYFLLATKSLNEELRKDYLNNLTKDDVINLFVELKTQYYNYKDNTRWN
jgi:hypothetical protein|tara:strand:- start:436 stop:669 length:234 start_codon:yes stop_codon:yes gene_type:complete